MMGVTEYKLGKIEIKRIDVNGIVKLLGHMTYDWLQKDWHNQVTNSNL